MTKSDPTRAVLTDDGRVLIKQADGSFRPAAQRTDWARTQETSDDDLTAAAKDDPDAQPLDEAFLRNAEIVNLISATEPKDADAPDKPGHDGQ